MNMMLPKFGSKAFRKGFVQGVTPVCGLFGRSDFRRARDIDTSMAAAWKEVGEALELALESQGAIHGETTRGRKPARSGRRK